MTTFSINPNYNVDEFSELFKKSFLSVPHELNPTGGCQIISKPFPCATFENFLTCSDNETTDIIQRLEDATRELKFTHKNSDLFTFNQSQDISNLSGQKKTWWRNLLLSFRHFLLSDVKLWLESITGLTLEPGVVDLTSSIYNKSDVLLCHDDELEGRRIAFILYLVPDDWNGETEGGCLQLFSDPNLKSDPNLQKPHPQISPFEVAVSLAPKRNLFAFFEVSAYSFHQVAEIIGDRPRISLHGWFHGKSLPRPTEPSFELAIQQISPTEIEEELLVKWINKTYLSPTTQAQICDQFSSLHEIQLHSFINTEMLDNLSDALCNIQESQWLSVGPYNRRHYDQLQSSMNPSTNSPPNSDLPDIIRQFQRLMASDALIVLLGNLTGLPLVVCDDEANGRDELMDEGSVPEKRTRHHSPSQDVIDHDEAPITLSFSTFTPPDIRRWRNESYTLLVDNDLANRIDPCLELIYHINGYGDEWQSEWGGEVIFCRQDASDPVSFSSDSDGADNSSTIIITNCNG